MITALYSDQRLYTLHLRDSRRIVDQSSWAAARLRTSMQYGTCTHEVCARRHPYDWMGTLPYQAHQTVRVGRVMVKVEPSPGMLRASTVPPWARTTCLTIARPRPVLRLPRLRPGSAT
jgi:hypothetical protein